MPELLETLKSWDGYISLSEAKKPENYEMRLKETLDLLSNAKGYSMHRHEFMLREALTTSDFPLLFGDVIDRQVLAAYKAVDPVWKSFVKTGTVKRIYPNIGGYRFAMSGGDQVLQEVAEKGEYHASEREETRYPVYVRKYGRQFDISWEAMINDDLDALKDTSERFARAAVRTEHRLVSGTYVADLVASAGLFSTATNRGVLPLTINNLATTMQLMGAFVDANGEPIINRPKYLVVGPGLEITARQILTSVNMAWVNDAVAAAVPVPTANVISQMGLQLVVDPYLPIFAPAHLMSWFLFADPKDIAALECDYLLGHERPEICMKSSDKVNIGGGEIGPMTGDFATDNVFYRVRDVFGCNRLDWRGVFGQLTNA